MMSANKRYAVHFTLAMIAYSLVLVGSITAINNGELSGWSAGLASLTPLIPAFYALRVFIARIQAMDEFQRRIATEAILWAAGVVGFAAFGYGFLEGAVDVPDISLIYVLPAICGVFGVVQCFLHWRASQ
jgi:hypothetical protein